MSNQPAWMITSLTYEIRWQTRCDLQQATKNHGKTNPLSHQHMALTHSVQIFQRTQTFWCLIWRQDIWRSRQNAHQSSTCQSRLDYSCCVRQYQKHVYEIVLRVNELGLEPWLNEHVDVRLQNTLISIINAAYLQKSSSKPDETSSSCDGEPSTIEYPWL